MAEYLEYLWQWIYKAINPSWGTADTIASILGILTPSFAKLFPRLEGKMNKLLWQIPLYIFAFLFIFRLLLAPYWIYQDQQAEIKELNGIITTYKNNVDDEKEEVIGLIDRAITDHERYIVIRNDLIKSMNENPSKITNYFNNTQIKESARFNALLSNDLLYDYCEPCFKLLGDTQEAIRSSIHSTNNPNKRLEDRLRHLKTNIQIIKVVNKQLQEVLKLINGKIDDIEFIERNQKLLRDLAASNPDIKFY